MPCENMTSIISIHSEVTHPLLRLSLIGSTFKPLGQRQDEERERIFVRPPLPGHESRGTTGVTTPDNQRGILNFHKVKASKKKVILLFGENHQLRLCKSVYRRVASQLKLHQLCQRTDTRLQQQVC